MVGRKSCHQSGYKSILLAAKARLSTSISAPRNKLCRLLIVVRLITAVLPELVDMVDRINMVGDSTCNICAVECETLVLQQIYKGTLEMQKFLEMRGLLYLHYLVVWGL